MTNLLREVRTRAGLSQRRLAAVMNVDHATINRVENGKESPTYKLMTGLVQTLHVDATDIFPALRYGEESDDAA